METKTINEEINQTLENIYNFIKTEEVIKNDFEEYKKTVGLYNSDNIEDFITYIFERGIPNTSKNPIMIFNDKEQTEISINMQNSFTSIFEIKKLLKSGFEAYNLINEKIYTLNSITKMSNFRGVGIGQYLVARVFEFEGETYIIEKIGCIAESKKEEAIKYAMAKIMQEPYLVYEDNKEKQKEIEENIKLMHSKFVEAFGVEELITSSKYADDIIGQFNDFAENGHPVDIDEKLVVPDTLKYFEINDVGSDYSNFVEDTLDSFSKHKYNYDTGIIYDKEDGLYVIPFYKTLLTILEQNSLEQIEGAKDCIKCFVTSPTFSANFIKRIYQKHPNFIDLANQVLEENLTFDKLLEKYKYEYLAHKIFAQTSILYNSKVFTNTLNYVIDKKSNNENIDYSKVGRNDPCPCGSGKKYKNCCLK